MWSHFDDVKTSRAAPAAAFITDCKRRVKCNGMPASTALQQSSAVAPDTTPVTGRQFYTERRMPRS